MSDDSGFQDTLDRFGEPALTVALENRKLYAEIAETDLRIEQLRRSLESNETGFEQFWGAIVKNLGVILPLLAAVVALWIQLDQFSHERKERQNLAVSKELITLLKQLNTGESVERRTAAVGLSLMGEPAIAILIENLDLDLETDLRRTTIESLSAIIEREGNAWLVLEPLLKATTAVFARDLVKPNNEITATNLEAHLDALASLAVRHKARLEIHHRMKIKAAARKLKADIEKSDSLTSGSNSEKELLYPWLGKLDQAFNVGTR